MADAPPPPAPARNTRTRTALIAAGLDLMVERPIDAIPIDDLVARAGVAKGSFFNHFADKHAFAAAVADEVRAELEAEVARANADIADPVERIAGGMAVAAAFALAQPRRTMVLLRSLGAATRQTHPLNRGLNEDLGAALAEGAVRPEAGAAGLLYWLGLCQVVVVHIVETRPTRSEAARLLEAMLAMGLAGLGVASARIGPVVAATLARWAPAPA